MAAAVLVAACGGEPVPPEQAVAERAQARWSAVIDGDHEAAWAFYAPGYRERVSAADLAVEMSGRPFRYEDAEVVRVACEEQQRCEARVAVAFEVPSAPNQLSGFQSRQGVDEIWLFIDGQWWYSP